MSAVWDILSNEITWSSAIGFAALLLFAASGEWVAERAGTLNISVEAMLLGGAFAAAVAYDATESVAVGIAGGGAAGLVLATLQANMSHRLTADQFVVGLTLNILALGLTGFLAGELRPRTRAVGATEIPGLADLPLLGPALFGQPWPLYLVYAVVPVVWWLLYRTRWGLEVRAVGEDPQAADVSGIRVNVRRRQSIYIAGFTSGLGGAYLLFDVGRFEDSMIGGRGFIAIVAVIFGGWTLRGTVAGCALFGAVVSFRLSLPQQGFEVSNELLSAAPYIVTVLVMAVFAARVRPPAALTRPFVRGLK